MEVLGQKTVNMSGTGDNLEDQRYSFVYNSKYPMNYNPGYISLFGFEKFEEHESWRKWMFNHWHWSVYASAIYVALVFGGQAFMKGREPMRLKTTLTLWNWSLALFSAIGFLRSAPELIVSVTNGSLHNSVCVLEHHNPATSLWGLLFALSKIVEFGDTAFIILRKQKLIFLHWYHHVTVCIYCWFAHGAHDPSSRWFANMNYAVHSTMYTYYSLKVLRVHIPKYIPMAITIFQMMQMVVGVIINIYTYQIKLAGQECDRPYSNIHLAFAMYFSYFLLFANFFWDAYFAKRKVKCQ